MSRALAFLVACGAACGSPPPPAAVTITQPLPTVVTPVAPLPHTTTTQAFLDAGCHDEKPDSIDCTGAKIDEIAKCREPLYIQNVTLDPPAVVALCYSSSPLNIDAGLREVGCMMRSHVHVIAATREGIVHVKTKEEFVSMFAPVTTPAEAIAFAVVLTGDAAYEKPFSSGANATIWVQGPQSTRPVVDGAGYRLRLFHGQVCGCAHPLSGNDYEVARDGTVTLEASTKLWEDASSRGLCVD
jgi:hypothetical protein